MIDKSLVVFFSLTLLSACGGSSNNSNSNTTNNATTNDITPTEQQAAIQISITSAPLNLTQTVNDDVNINIQGSWASNDVAARDVYLQVYDPAGRIQTPASMAGTVSNTFSFNTTIQTGIAAGYYTGQLIIRACQDAACAKPYPNQRKTLAYQLTINKEIAGDWETFQGSASHQGYIPITVDPQHFKKAWEWTHPSIATLGYGLINSIVTSNDKVFITYDTHFADGVLYALNEKDGAIAWRVSLGTVPSLSPPAVSQGQVYAAVGGHEDSALWAFDAETGKYRFKAAFESQWPSLLAPTIDNKQAYLLSGYYGGVTYAYSTQDGTRQWANEAGGLWDMATPAVDANFVYHYNGKILNVINAKTGNTDTQIDDPFGNNTDNYSYFGAPILGTRHNLIAFAGGAFSGNSNSSSEPYDQRVLSSFNLATKQYEWSTAYAYLTTPAVGNGVIYAARNNPMSLDAVDEATGQILWSWTPTMTTDTSFHRNTVLTNNLLFVSTDVATYAIDLKSKQSVWSYPAAGMLSLSANRTLYIATGATISDGHLIAIHLNAK